jgi:hypothetical protein
MWAAGLGRPGAVLLGRTTMWPGQAGWLRAVRARPHADFGLLARDSIKIIFHFQIQVQALVIHIFWYSAPKFMKLILLGF